MFLKKVKKRYLIPGVLVFLFLVSIPVSLHDGYIGNEIGSKYSTLAIRNVNVVPMDADTGRVLLNQVVFIKNGLIEFIQPDVGQDISAEKTIVAQDNYLIPGLMDAHTHYFDVYDLPQTIAFGVTNVRVMMGMPMHLRWREKINHGIITGPEMIIGTPTLNAGNDVGPFHLNLDKVKDIPSKIEEYQDIGYDFVKTYSGLNETQLKLIFSTAKALDMNVAGHLPEEIDPFLFLKNNPISIEHLESIAEVVFKNNPDSTSMEIFAASLLENNTQVVPTMGVINNYSHVMGEGVNFSERYSDYVNPLIESIFITRNIERVLNASEGLQRAFEKENQTNKIIFRGLQRYNVSIAAGTDSGPMYIVNGLSLLEELELYVEYGLTPYKALESATRNAAQLLELDNSGQIKKDFKANLVLLKANPLTKISSIKDQAYVFTPNKYFHINDLNSLKKISKNKTGFYPTIIRLLEHKIRL